MIKASKILLFSDAETIPFIMDDTEMAWDLAGYAEELANRIAKRMGKKVVNGLKLVPMKTRPGRGVASTETFRTQYRGAIAKGLAGCDGIAVLPGLGKASETPSWLKELADSRYIPIGPFSSFFGADAGSDIFMETSRRRMDLLTSRIPNGREGRGGRTK